MAVEQTGSRYRAPRRRTGLRGRGGVTDLWCTSRENCNNMGGRQKGWLGVVHGKGASGSGVRLIGQAWLTAGEMEPAKDSEGA